MKFCLILFAVVFVSLYSECQQAVTDVKRTLINHYEWLAIPFETSKNAELANLLASFAADRIYVTGSSPYRWKVIKIIHFMQSAKFICEFTMNRNFDKNDYEVDKSTCYPEHTTPIGWSLYTM